MSNEDRAKEREGNAALQRTMSWVAIGILTVFGSVALVKLFTFHRTEGEFWKTLVREQFPVVIGLPMAGAGALFVTLILRVATGPMECDIAGFRFKGGAAPIVFWMICFLAVVVSIRLLWQPAG